MDAVFINCISFHWDSLFNRGRLSRITQFERQASLVVDDPYSATGQLFSDLFFAGKIRCQESLDDLCLGWSWFTKMLFYFHVDLLLSLLLLVLVNRRSRHYEHNEHQLPDWLLFPVT